MIKVSLQTANIFPQELIEEIVRANLIPPLEDNPQSLFNLSKITLYI